MYMFICEEEKKNCKGHREQSNYDQSNDGFSSKSIILTVFYIVKNKMVTFAYSSL